MNKRTIGQTNIQIAPLILGGNVFGWTVDQAKSFVILDAFLEAGLNCIDTADVYSAWIPGNKGGESETIIGQWMHARDNRNRVVIATKVGMEMGPGKKGLARNYVIQAIEASLKQLQTDYVDLYQSHRDDPETPVEETLAAYDQLVKQGKVRAIGASNYSAARLAASLEAGARLKMPAYQTLQPHYNLYEREDFEKNLRPICLEKGIGVIPYFSLAMGFLTGKYRSEADLGKSPRGKGVGKYLNPRGMKILAGLDKVSAQAESTPARVALAWLMAQPAVLAPIASATSLDQLKDLVESTKLSLSRSHVEMLSEASSPASA